MVVQFEGAFKRKSMQFLCARLLALARTHNLKAAAACALAVCRGCRALARARMRAEGARSLVAAHALSTTLPNVSRRRRRVSLFSPRLFSTALSLRSLLASAAR